MMESVKRAAPGILAYPAAETSRKTVVCEQ